MLVLDCRDVQLLLLAETNSAGREKSENGLRQKDNADRFRTLFRFLCFLAEDISMNAGFGSAIAVGIKEILSSNQRLQLIDCSIIFGGSIVFRQKAKKSQIKTDIQRGELVERAHTTIVKRPPQHASNGRF
jgi:hypothetical protein